MTVVRNISTSISFEKTLMEIEQILVRFGAEGIYKEYRGSNISGLMFFLIIKGQKIPFKIPMSIEKSRRIIIQAVKEGKLPKKFNFEPLTTEQGIRVGWRIIKDWIHSQMSLLEMEFAEPLEILLPYAWNPIQQKTAYEMFVDQKEKFLALEHKEEGGEKK
jgi:hypothetical protein